MVMGACRCEFCESERIDEQLDALALEESEAPALLLVIVLGASVALSCAISLWALWALAVMLGLAP